MTFLSTSSPRISLLEINCTLSDEMRQKHSTFTLVATFSAPMQRAGLHLEPFPSGGQMASLKFEGANGCLEGSGGMPCLLGNFIFSEGQNLV